MKSVVSRFLKYVAIDTQGNDQNTACPSSENQRLLAELLLEELNEMGVTDVFIDEKCFLYAKIPANTKKEVPGLAFFAHLDTNPTVPGGHVKPRIVENYDGEEILLNKSQNISLSPVDFPCLKECLGDDLIVTDGTTLLGADGKAGIAEIMEAIKYVMEHPELKHGQICVVFTPDEELGYSTEYIDMQNVPAKFGFTLDGGGIGEIHCENFNAATVTITVCGQHIHPGTAKDLMKNAILLANEFIRLLPAAETPSHTQGSEGYYHISDIRGGIEQCIMTYNIRDFDAEKYEYRKGRIKKAAEFLNNYYGEETFHVEVEDYYLNMKQIVDKHPEILDIAGKAMKLAGVEPQIMPIRGGTDGVTISFMGLPCPNLFTGCYNSQSIHEFVAIGTMEKSVEVMLNMIELFAQE